jgi:GNAT superfamily N-acetyltransferase
MQFDDVPGQFFVSTEKPLLDTLLVFRELKKTYWGTWLSSAIVEKSIATSLCFGLYLRDVDGQPVNRQIGFARVVTDYATFCWLCDVFVVEKFRKQGLGKFLLHTVMQHPEVKGRSVLLCTKDAQKFYSRYGFTPMECLKRPGGAH